MIVIDDDNNKELHILSYHYRSQTGNYYLIDAAQNKATIFCFSFKEEVVNTIFLNRVDQDG